MIKVVKSVNTSYSIVLVCSVNYSLNIIIKYNKSFESLNLKDYLPSSEAVETF